MILTAEKVRRQEEIRKQVRERLGTDLGLCPDCVEITPSLPAPADGTCAFCYTHQLSGPALIQFYLRNMNKEGFV